jgi:crotonobetainyl-CoA:carnitine CoA-transferase CaiB-like acyl-CoA transferase
MERAPPSLGEHTAEILAAYLGYGPEHVARLRDARVI